MRWRGLRRCAVEAASRSCGDGRVPAVVFSLWDLVCGICIRLFLVPAGMFLRSGSHLPAPCIAPCLCGDGSKVGWFRDLVDVCSPRRRGWPQAVWEAGCWPLCSSRTWGMVSSPPGRWVDRVPAPRSCGDGPYCQFCQRYASRCFLRAGGGPGSASDNRSDGFGPAWRVCGICMWLVWGLLLWCQVVLWVVVLRCRHGRGVCGWLTVSVGERLCVWFRGLLVSRRGLSCPS